MVDVSSEWRTFANDTESKDMCRVGAVEDPTLGGSDLSTSIGRATGSAGFDENGKPIYRNKFSESSGDKARRMANRELNEMAERLSVDKSIVSTAQHIYYTIHKNKLIKGRSNDAVIAACMYIACNNESVPRTFKEICAVSNSSKRDIGRCFKIIKKEVETNYNSTTPADLITRFCSKLNLPKPVQKLAELIVNKASNIESINGRSPVSLAAASIYIAAEVTGNERTLEEISKICGAAVTTIKITCKPIQLNLKDILPQEYQSLKTITNKS
jgi:transcription initiation factor TFIIB